MTVKFLANISKEIIESIGYFGFIITFALLFVSLWGGFVDFIFDFRITSFITFHVFQ